MPAEAVADTELRVLSQLLLLQGTLHIFQDFERLASFIERGLEEVPGVRRVRLLGPGPGGEAAPSAPSPQTLTLPLDTSGGSHGRLEMELGDRRAFAAYRAVVENTVNVIAVHLERQANERALRGLNESLTEEIARRDEAEQLLGKAQQRLDELLGRNPPPSAGAGGGPELFPPAPRLRAEASPQGDLAAARLGAALLLPTAMEEISAVVLRHVEQLTESAAACVAIVELEDGEIVEKARAEDISTRTAHGSLEHVLPVFPELWQQVVADRKGGFVNLPASDSAPESPRRLLAVPVSWGSRLVGYIAAIDASRDYGAEDLALVERLASLLALAVRRQQMLEEEHQLGRQFQRSQRLEALGTLASGIAHEFRNLLQIILGSAEIVLAKPGVETVASQDLEAIREAANRGATLTEQLLTFARRSEPTMEVLDLNETVRHAAAMLKRTLPRSIKLDVRLAGDVGASLGDAGQIEQVLVNLALNARDAMPEGGRLTLETRPHADEEATSEILVSDTGTGICSRDIEHIFEPFFTTKGPTQGTGLGLSVAYGIVTGHGGRLTCTSDPGVGTTFAISLPRVEEVPEPDTASRQRPSVAAARGETVLVVDDEAPIRQLLRLGLGRYGYRVCEAASGEEAIELYRSGERAVDLVILDLGMAGMGGRLCLEQLLRLDPAAKVLVATGYAVDGGEVQHIEGARGVIAKPFRFDALAEKVRATLDLEA